MQWRGGAVRWAYRCTQQAAGVLWPFLNGCRRRPTTEHPTFACRRRHGDSLQSPNYDLLPGLAWRRPLVGCPRRGEKHMKSGMARRGVVCTIDVEHSERHPCGGSHGTWTWEPLKGTFQAAFLVLFPTTSLPSIARPFHSAPARASPSSKPTRSNVQSNPPLHSLPPQVHPFHSLALFLICLARPSVFTRLWPQSQDASASP